MPLADRIPPFLLTLALSALMLLALELGHWLSRGDKGDIVTMQTAVLGLAGLLLAFSFAIAEDRYNERRLMVVKEANAIGTMYLRAGMLPEPARSGLRTRLERYVDFRLEAADKGVTTEQFKRLLDQYGALQGEMWSLLEKQAKEIPTAQLLLSTEALNAVIDVSAERASAARTNVPGGVLLLLVAVILFCGGAIGYQPEAKGRAFSKWALFAVPLLLAFHTVVDLNSPREGFIHTSQQPMVELRESMRTTERAARRPAPPPRPSPGRR